jgi:hypothetical protein
VERALGAPQRNGQARAWCPRRGYDAPRGSDDGRAAATAAAAGAMGELLEPGSWNVRASGERWHLAQRRRLAAARADISPRDDSPGASSSCLHLPRRSYFCKFLNPLFIFEKIMKNKI